MANNESSVAWWSYALLLVGPTLCCIYSILSLIMNAMWHECHWDAYNQAIFLRLSLLIAGVGLCFGICDNDSVVETTDASLAICIPVGVVITIISILLMRSTRIYCIEGGPSKLPALVMDDKKLESLKDKVIFITGANAGIGKETAKQLLSWGAIIIFGCRSEKRAKDAIEDIIESLVGNDVKEGDVGKDMKEKEYRSKMHFIPLDLSNFDSIRKAVTQFEQLNMPLHMLINNAGIMMSEKHVSTDGIELMMQANHFGHFLLTNLLLEKLFKSSSEKMLPRVIMLSSSTHMLATNGFDFDDTFCDKGKRQYTLFGQYGQTKLANILFTKQLASKYSSSLISVAVHPGMVRTDGIVQNHPWYLYYPNIWFAWFIASVQKTPSQGARTTLYCCIESDEVLLSSNGSYYVNSVVSETSKHANNTKDAEKLWKLSEEVVGLYNE